MNNMGKIIVRVLVLIMLCIVGYVLYPIIFEREIAEKELSKKYKCISCEDCMTKYNFEAAHAFLSITCKYDYFCEEISIKLLNSETNYWITLKEYQRALSVVDEYKSEGGFDEDKIKIKFDVLSLIIDNYIAEKDFSNAKLYALKSSDNINLSGYSKSYSYDSEDQWRSQQTELLERIDKAEKILK